MFWCSFKLVVYSYESEGGGNEKNKNERVDIFYTD